ncbi:MAG: Gfo/Idh/MocA family oxidoreductase [Planctomycetes bacterium]|nr:Gfo/Idh/MocA family oxidoreductase [Planctomycetota bacterium]
MKPIRVLVVGCGNMGSSHARAYQSLPGFQLVGLCSRLDDRLRLAEQLGGGIPTFLEFDQALAQTRPDAVSVNTYPDTHAALVRASLQAGAHVFVEKPLATTVAEAQQLVDLAQQKKRKMMVGYILRVHPAWQRFIEVARTLGKPLVMRMNLNQQSRGKDWQTHKNLMASMSPIVDCGVHYVDVMCQMTGSRPVRVSAIGARLSDEIAPTMYNYGQLQVAFADGSVGWYECGWGPMMSEVAYFVKDVVGPKGCVSITEKGGERKLGSADIGSHTKTNSLKLHHAARNADGSFAKPDEWIDTHDEPDHDGLCRREQEAFLKAIRDDVDLGQHLRDAVDSLRIVLAADEAARTGQTVKL